jgi:hypothetical protein
VLATDIRFASETAVLSQFEVSVGALPGDGPGAHLERLAGRGRALLQVYFPTAGRPENRPFAQLSLKNGLQQPHGIETDLGTAIGRLRPNLLAAGRLADNPSAMPSTRIMS